MAYQNVVVQGIEFSNLLVTNSIMYEPSIGETFAIETTAEPEPVYLDFEVADSSENKEAAVKKQRSYLGAFVHQLSSWLNNRAVTSCPTSPNDLDDEELWEEWEWILSEAEKFVCRRSVEEANEIQNELEKLRKNANLLKSRPGFLNAARQAIDMVPLSEEERVLLSTMVLDSNKRSKIITDVVSFYSDDWLHFIEHLFFTGQENSETLLKAYRDSYPDRTYQKGVLGGLKEAGWQASHGPGTVGLTHYILGDIIWAFWKMLVSSIRYTLDRELEAGELNLLAEKLYDCQDYLLELWITTVKNCEFGAAREGDLPKKWALEAEEERKRMVAIKKSGVNARYEYKPVVILDSERKQLGDLKKFLEMSLHFHVTTGVKTGHK